MEIDAAMIAKDGQIKIKNPRSTVVYTKATLKFMVVWLILLDWLGLTLREALGMVLLRLKQIIDQQMF